MLIGEGSLCRRYAEALAHFAIAATQIGNTAPRGLYQFAVAARLVAVQGDY